MPEKPANLIYGVDEKPPMVTMWLLGLQHLCIFSISLIFPVLIVRGMGGTAEQADFMIDMSLLAAGVGAILQALKKGPVGSGYLCPQVCGPSFLTASITAGSLGGLPLVMGMTVVAGVFESLFSRIMHKLRFLFPAEVTGFIVAMVGITVIPTAMRNLLGYHVAPGEIHHFSLLVGLLTLAVMVGLNVWSKGKLKLYCIIIGMGVGYAASYAADLFNHAQIQHIMTTSWVDFPLLEHPGWSFDIHMLLPVLVATLCSSLKTVGDLTTCQKINDVKWNRPDMNNIKKGILADGLGCLTAGIVGGAGQSTSSTNVGLSIATGATSRFIAMTMGAIAIMLAFSPKLASFFTIMPPPVMGATLVFALSFMIVAGFQIVMSRMLDARKTFVIGISMIVGLSVDIMPEAYSGVPHWLAPVFSSSLSVAAVMAVLLNIVFRIGIAKKVTIDIEAKPRAQREALAFLQKNGAAWAARREIIDKAGDALSELVETLVVHGMAVGQMRVKAAFNELNLNVSVEYDGDALDLPEEPPEAEELISDKQAHRNLAGFLIRQYADKVELSQTGGRQMVSLQFTH